MKIFLSIIVVILLILISAILYVLITKKTKEFSIPIWTNVEFYVLISPEIIKIGFIYL